MQAVRKVKYIYIDTDTEVIRLFVLISSSSPLEGINVDNGSKYNYKSCTFYEIFNLSHMRVPS